VRGGEEGGGGGVKERVRYGMEGGKEKGYGWDKEKGEGEAGGLKRKNSCEDERYVGPVKNGTSSLPHRGQVRPKETEGVEKLEGPYTEYRLSWIKSRQRDRVLYNTLAAKIIHIEFQMGGAPESLIVHSLRGLQIRTAGGIFPLFFRTQTIWNGMMSFDLS